MFKVKINTLENKLNWRQGRRSGVFIINLNIIHTIILIVFIVDFEHVFGYWIKKYCAKLLKYFSYYFLPDHPHLGYWVKAKPKAKY